MRITDFGNRSATFEVARDRIIRSREHQAPGRVIPLDRIFLGPRTLRRTRRRSYACRTRLRGRSLCGQTYTPNDRDCRARFRCDIQELAAAEFEDFRHELTPVLGPTRTSRPSRRKHRKGWEFPWFGFATPQLLDSSTPRLFVFIDILALFRRIQVEKTRVESRRVTNRQPLTRPLDLAPQLLDSSTPQLLDCLFS
jgi:hypothetical protein